MNIKTGFRLLFLVFVLILSISACSACKKMTPTTPGTFKTTMESLGYTVIDTTDKFENDMKIDIESMYIASKGSIQFGFVACSSSDMAIDIYNSSLENFEEKESSANLSTSVNIGNHSKCTLDNGKEFMVCSRIDDTCIAASADNADKSEIKDVLKQLGY